MRTDYRSPRAEERMQLAVHGSTHFRMGYLATALELLALPVCALLTVSTPGKARRSVEARGF